MPLPSSPEFFVGSIVKAEQNDVGVNDMHAHSGPYGHVSVSSHGRVVKRWRCWMKTDAGSETYFDGAGDNPYREGHRVVMAFYNDQLMGHHNPAMNSTTILSRQPIPGVLSFIKLMLVFPFLCLLAPICFLLSLSAWLRKSEGKCAEIQYPGAEADATPNARNLAFGFGALSLICLAAVLGIVGVENLWLGFLLISPTLATLQFVFFRKASKARAALQAAVAAKMAELGRTDRTKSSSPVTASA